MNTDHAGNQKGQQRAWHGSSPQQLQTYLTEEEKTLVEKSLDFWAARHPASASEAFVEKIFSLCGLLTAGRWNYTCKTLEMQTFLK